MKILSVLRAAGAFPYHQTTVDHLIRRGHEVTLLFETRPEPPDDAGFQEWVAEHRHQVAVGEALRRRDLWRRVLFATREIRSYASYCRRGPDAAFYRDRWRRYMPRWLDWLTEHGAIPQAAFRLTLTHRLLAAVERAAPPSAEIVAALRRDRPHCVVASPVNVLADGEVEYVKAARAVGIPGIVPVLSWDNLTTKGVFHVQPDFVLAWHVGHEEEAQVIHGIPADRDRAGGAQADGGCDYRGYRSRTQQSPLAYAADSRARTG